MTSCKEIEDELLNILSDLRKTGFNCNISCPVCNQIVTTLRDDDLDKYCSHRRNCKSV